VNLNQAPFGGPLLGHGPHGPWSPPYCPGRRTARARDQCPECRDQRRPAGGRAGLGRAGSGCRGRTPVAPGGGQPPALRAWDLRPAVRPWPRPLPRGTV